MHLLQTTARDVHRARRNHHLKLAARSRLRNVVVRIDRAIVDCEETHLLGYKRVTPELQVGARAAINCAERAAAVSGDQHAICRVARNAARTPRKISDLMDQLWEIEDAVFDLMIPGRPHEYDHDEDDEPYGMEDDGYLPARRPVGSAA